MADKIEADEDNRYEAENQFLGLVEDTLNDMGITVYDEYDESKKVEGNKIPRNWKKITYKAKVDTNLNNVGDTIEVERDEWNRPIMKNLRTGKTGQTFIDNLRNDDLAEIVDIKTEGNAKNTYGKTNADEINETIKDKEFMNNLGITAEDVIKQVEISKKDFDELVNYVNNYKGTFGELYKELQGWNLGDSNVEQDDDNLFDCYYKSLLVTINVDDGKLSVSPIDVYVYPNDITNVDSDELFHLDFDKPIEFDKILKEDATQCGAVDGGRVSIFGEKEKKEEAQDVEYDTDKLLEDILNNVPVEVKHLGNYAYEYKGLYIELRPDTIFTDNTPPEMDFAIFEDEEDMNTDYELNIGTGYAAMTPYYRYWEAVMLYCDKLLK